MHRARHPLVAAVPLACLLAGSFFSNEAQAASLVARYEFENAANLGLDLAGGDDNATPLGGVTQTTGRAPGTFAASFDGFDDLLRRNGGLTGYDGLPGVTFTAWVNSAPPDGTFDGIISQDAGVCCGYRVLLDGASNLYINSGVHQDVANAGNVPAGAWHHVAMTVQDNGNGSRTAQLYVDGSPLGAPSPFTQAPGLSDASAWNTYIGAGEAGTAHLFRGGLDDVRIYDGALTPDEVRAVFNDTAVPEPAALATALLAAGLLGFRRRR